MKDFTKRPASERMEFIIQASLKSGLAKPIIEKDFWVCWVLTKIFSLPGISEHLLFKGGTSLSKAYGVIERFSEDVDISIDRAFLGFGGDNDPFAAPSRTAQDKKLESLQAHCIEAVKSKIAPALEQAINEELLSPIKLEVDSQDPLALLFTFPSVESTAFSYITPYIKLEFGARADLWPQTVRKIRSYLSDAFPDLLSEGDGFEVPLLSAERTFWEKVTILHQEYHRPESKPLPLRLSRHYYDLFCLLGSDIGKGAKEDLELLKLVVAHKLIFFRSGWAKYENAVPGTLRLVPGSTRLPELESDYLRMESMFFADPPSFDVVIERLREFEEEFNANR